RFSPKNSLWLRTRHIVESPKIVCDRRGSVCAAAGTGPFRQRQPVMSSAIPLQVLPTTPPPESPAGAEEISISPIHDFTAKLRHPDILPRLKQYVAWRAARQAGSREPTPAFAPVSINLDLTTVCNYRCDHCIDLE